jgi:hypothetical protein
MEITDAMVERALEAANGAMVDTRPFWTDGDKAAVRAMLATLSEKKDTIAVPVATLEKWKEAIEPFWFSSDGEEDYNNDGVIDTSKEIDALLASHRQEAHK